MCMAMAAVEKADHCLSVYVSQGNLQLISTCDGRCYKKSSIILKYRFPCRCGQCNVYSMTEKPCTEASSSDCIPIIYNVDFSFENCKLQRVRLYCESYALLQNDMELECETKHLQSCFEKILTGVRSLLSESIFYVPDVVLEKNPTFLSSLVSLKSYLKKMVSNNQSVEMDNVLKDLDDYEDTLNEYFKKNYRTFICPHDKLCIVVVDSQWLLPASYKGMQALQQRVSEVIATSSPLASKYLVKFSSSKLMSKIVSNELLVQQETNMCPICNSALINGKCHTCTYVTSTQGLRLSETPVQLGSPLKHF